MSKDYPEDLMFKRMSSLLPSWMPKRRKKNIKKLAEKEEKLKNEQLKQSSSAASFGVMEDEELYDSFQQQEYDEFKLEMYKEVFCLIQENEKNPIESVYLKNHIRNAFKINEKTHSAVLKELEIKRFSNQSDITEMGHEAIDVDIKKSIEVHHSLLQIFLRYDLRTIDVQKFKWNGHFSDTVQKILALHSTSRQIDQIYLVFTKWIAFVEVHMDYPLSLSVFLDLLKNLIENETSKETIASNRFSEKLEKLQYLFKLITIRFGASTNGQMSDENSNKVKLNTIDEEIIKLFWKSTEKFLGSILNFIRCRYDDEVKGQIKKKPAILEQIFKVFSVINHIGTPDDFKYKNVNESIKDALRESFVDNLVQESNINALKQSNGIEKRLDMMINMLELAKKHNEEFVKTFEMFFNLYFDVSISRFLYEINDSIFADKIKPFALEVSFTNKDLCSNFRTSAAGKLLKLYCELKKFTDHGIEVYEDLDIQTKDYYTWFDFGVDAGIGVSVFNATSRIQRAVYYDGKQPSDGPSQSFTKTIEILQSLKSFWENQQKIHINEDYSKFFKADFCRFSVFYFQKFTEKIHTRTEVNNFDVMSEKFFELINNYDYLEVELKKMVNTEENKVTGTDEYAKMVLKKVKSVIDTRIICIVVEYKHLIEDLILSDAKCDENTKFEDINDCHVADSSLKYAKQILDMILRYDKGQHYREFKVLKQCLWRNILEIFSRLSQDSSEHEQPRYFTKLSKIFDRFKELFGVFKEFEAKVTRIDFLLECYGHSTSRLIHKYYKERHAKLEEFENPSEIENESQRNLSVNCYFKDNLLVLNIINFAGFNELRKNNYFINISIIPEKYFKKSFTSDIDVQSKINKQFEFEVTDEQRDIKDAIIYVYVEKKKRFGKTEFHFESFISFKDIQDKDVDYVFTLRHVASINEDLISLEAIESRSKIGDKEAKAFLQKVKSTIVL